MKYNEKQLKKLIRFLFAIDLGRETALEGLRETILPDFAANMMRNTMKKDLTLMYSLFKENFSIDDVISSEEVTDFKHSLKKIYEKTKVSDLSDTKIIVLGSLFSNDKNIEALINSENNLDWFLKEFIEKKGPSILKDEDPCAVGDEVMFVEEHAVNFLVSKYSGKLCVLESRNPEEMAEEMYGKKFIVTSITDPVMYKCSGCDEDHLADISVRFEETQEEFSINNLLLTRYIDVSIEDD